MDQRGRIYCSPSYLNYQSSELSKALTLFANLGVIHRNKMESVNYMKAYGANCFSNNKNKLYYTAGFFLLDMA